MPLPTPTPTQLALKKVLTISQVNGWSVALFAGLCTLVSLFFGELLGFGVGLLVVASGVMEIRGHRLLKRRNADGLTWLVRSQLFLLSVLLVYAVSRLLSFDGETVLSNLMPEMETVLGGFGIIRADIVPMVEPFFRAFYGAIILAALIYQGGLACFYRRKSPLVIEALAAPRV